MGNHSTAANDGGVYAGVRQYRGLSPDGVPPFIFYLAGTVLWTYFSGCLTQTANTFVANSATMGKVYFPRLVMPISTVFSELISFAIQYGFLLIFLVYYTVTKQGVHPNLWMLMTPLIILQLAMLSLGCGIIISALTTKYRDLAMLVGFGVQLWMYGSPIAYDMFRFGAFAPGGKWHVLYMCNPISPIVNLFLLCLFGYRRDGMELLSHRLGYHHGIPVSWCSAVQPRGKNVYGYSLRK